MIEMQASTYNGVGAGQFDVQNYFVNPLVGELVAIPASATGSLEFSDNVTQLTFTSLPEPASSALALFGLGTLAVLHQRRKKADAS